MNQPAKLVFIYVQFPVAVNQKLEPADKIGHGLGKVVDFPLGFESVFDKCKDHWRKLGVGAYLADEAACYPAILELVQMCKDHNLPLMIVAIGENVTSSPAYLNLKEWLTKRGNSFRLTEFPKPESKPEP